MTTMALHEYNEDMIHARLRIDKDEYLRRVLALEAEGLCTSDAQGVVDAELLKAYRARLEKTRLGKWEA